MMMNNQLNKSLQAKLKMFRIKRNKMIKKRLLLQVMRSRKVIQVRSQLEDVDTFVDYN